MKIHTLVLLSLLPLPGCMISIGGSDFDAGAVASEVHELRRDTRRRLGRLHIGMTRADVDAVMGTSSSWINDEIGWVDRPYRSAAYRDAEGCDVVVLYYYTDLRRRDNVIDDDELTPVVLRDGEVIGWGRDFEPPPREH